MSYTSKQDLIEILIPGLAAKARSNERDVRAALNTYSLQDLKIELEKQKAEGLIETPARSNSAPVVPPRRSQDRASDEEVEQAVRSLETLKQSEEKLLRAQAELAVGREVFRLEQQKLNQPQRDAEASAQLAEDRATFADAARKFNLANNEANFRLVRELLGPGFRVGQVRGLVGLAPASEEEIQTWNAEAAEERKEFLVNRASPDELRAAVRAETIDARTQQAQTETDRQLEALRLRDVPFNYPALPAEFTKGILLQMVKQDTKRYRFILSKFGNYNVSARLQGRG